MKDKRKTQQAILDKLDIEALNPMQISAQEAIEKHDELILLSPTGSGKTLAFLLPIIAQLDREIKDPQVLILVPSRELAIQIEQVMRDMGSGFKGNAVYGGRSISNDKIELATPPAILIGTPGRVADHLRRETISTSQINTLVLDEFDKSLEIGFEEDMKEIVSFLSSLKKKVLTSATEQIQVPSFVGIDNPYKLNFLEQKTPALEVRVVLTREKDKLDGLVDLVRSLGNKNGIIFCNFKDTIHFVSNHLTDQEVPHDCFYGGLEQRDRERALIKFRNGSHRLLIATDLAARGIDVPAMNFIIHYQLPLDAAGFTHRNGRTARMHQEGTAFILLWEKDPLPDFIKEPQQYIPQKNVQLLKAQRITLFISGGRKDKISKGDIAGLFFKQGNLKKDELGLIELKQDCAFVAVPKSKAFMLIKKLNDVRLKKKKVRITRLD